MLELEDALGADSLPDGGQDARLIFGVDVIVEPVSAGLLGFGEEFAAFHMPLELVHLAPVGAHAIHGVGAGGDQGAQATFTLVEGMVGDAGVLTVDRVCVRINLCS